MEYGVIVQHTPVHWAVEVDSILVVVLNLLDLTLLVMVSKVILSQLDSALKLSTEVADSGVGKDHSELETTL